MWLPSVRLGRVHELQDPQRTLTLRFAEDANATPVRFLTDQPDRDWWEMGLGLAWLRPGGPMSYAAFADEVVAVLERGLSGQGPG